MRNWQAVFATLMIPLAFACGAWAEHGREESHASGTPNVVDRTVTIADRTNREDAVLTMFRLGAEDWLLACAWQTGHDGQPRDAMYRACSLELGIGEKQHPERRKPSSQSR